MPNTTNHLTQPTSEEIEERADEIRSALGLDDDATIEDLEEQVAEEFAHFDDTFEPGYAEEFTNFLDYLTSF